MIEFFAFARVFALRQSGGHGSQASIRPFAAESTSCALSQGKKGSQKPRGLDVDEWILAEFQAVLEAAFQAAL